SIYFLIRLPFYFFFYSSCVLRDLHSFPTRRSSDLFAVREVVPLVRVEHAVLLGRLELLRGARRDVHVVVRIAIRHGRHLAELRTAKPQRILLLLRLRVRHQDQRAVAARVADQREAYAGIAGRALDDQAAALDRAAALAVEHDVLRRPILDRAARVHELRFAENLAAGELRSLPQTNQGRVADGVEKIRANVHGCSRASVESPRRRAGRSLYTPGPSRQPRCGPSVRTRGLPDAAKRPR